MGTSGTGKCIFLYDQDKDVYAEIGSHKFQDNDYLLLCTDGLSSYVGHETIEKILSSSSDTPTHCQHLVDAANANGGLDNVTGEHSVNLTLPAIASDDA